MIYYPYRRANKDYEYQYEGYQGATETVLLGNVIRRMHKGKEDETPYGYPE